MPTAFMIMNMGCFRQIFEKASMQVCWPEDMASGKHELDASRDAQDLNANAPLR